MADKETMTLLIDVKVEQKEVLKQQEALKASWAAAKDVLDKMKSYGDTLSSAYINQEATVKSLNNQLAANQRVLTSLVKDVDGYSGAYATANKAAADAAIKAKDMAFAYGENDARTKDAVKSAKALSDQLKAVDSSVGQNQRSVGDYGIALKGLGGSFSGNVKAINEFVQSSGGVSGAMSAASSGVAGFGKQMMALLANPIVAIIAGIVAVFMLLKGAISDNGAATAKFNQILAPFKVITELVSVALGKLASVLLDGVMAVGEFIGKIASFIPGLSKINELSKEAIALKKEEQKLGGAVREQLVTNAKTELQIAELKQKAKQKDKYTDEERLKFIREANNLEKNMSLEKTNLAIRQFNLYKKQMAERKQSYTDLTKDEKDKYKGLEADIYKARTEYFQGTLRLKAQESTLVLDIEKEKSDKIAASEAAAERYQEKLAAIREKRAADKKRADDKAIADKKKAEEDEFNRLKKNSDDALSVLDYGIKMAQLKEQERLAGQKLTDEQISANKKASINQSYTDEINSQKILLDNKQITQQQYDDAEKLAAQEQRTAIALEDANFAAVQAETKKTAQAIEYQAEYDLKQMSLDLNFQAEKDALDRSYATQIEAANKVGADTTNITALYNKQKVAIEQKSTSAKLDMASSFAGNIAEIFGKQSKVGKMAASAQIAVDTAKGAMSAFTSMSSIPIVGPALGAVAAGAVIAKGVRSVKDVWAVKSGLPGDSGGGSGAVTATAPTVAATPAAAQLTTTGAVVARQSGATQQSASVSAIDEALKANPVQPVLVTNDLTIATNQKVKLKTDNSL